MFTKNVNSPKVWKRFAKMIGANKTLNFRLEQLSISRYEEFIDFVLNHFVKHEITHVVAGIPKNLEAMQEYKEILTKAYKEPAYHTFICCVDDEKSKIVGFDSLKLYRKGEFYENIIPGKTPEVKRFNDIVEKFNELCYVPDILTKYGVDKFFDDAGCAVHADYRGYDIANEITLNMTNVCKENSVPLCGAWITSVATQKSSALAGWETVYEIGYEELEKKLAVTFDSPPPTFKFKVNKV